MNKRIQKKKITQKRNASRKAILSMDEGLDKYRALMIHVIRFNDPGFFHEVIGPGPYHIVMPRMNGRKLFYDLMFEYLNKKERKKMHNYTEFDKLVKMLDDAKIPYERDDDDPDLEYYKRTGNKPVKRIKYGRFPGEKIGCICSVICGHGTYGGDEGLLEIMGLLTPGEEEQGDVVGWLSAEDVFNRIKNHYDSNKEKEA